MRVGFFVTCLVDLMRPSIGFAAHQAARSGRGGRLRARRRRPAAASPPTTPATAPTPSRWRARCVDEFEGCDYLVAPSGSCSGMIRTHYADLFADDPAMRRARAALAGRTYELTDFLVNVLKLERVPGHVRGHGHLSRLLRRPARDGRQGAAARAARPRCRASQLDGDGRVRDVLRVRRHVLDQVRRDLRAPGRQQMPATSQRPAPMPSCWATSAAC